MNLMLKTHSGSDNRSRFKDFHWHFVANGGTTVYFGQVVAWFFYVYNITNNNQEVVILFIFLCTYICKLNKQPRNCKVFY